MIKNGTTRAEKDAALLRSEPIAPMCEQYLDFSTLGGKEERASVTRTLVDHFCESTSTSEPEAEAERLMRTLDDVTVNLIRVALDGDFWQGRSVNVFLHRSLSGIRVRTYMLLMYGINDVPARSGSSSLMNGLHERRQDEGGRDELVIDISTNDLYKRYVALLRYGVRVTSELELNESKDMFIEHRMTGDLKLIPEVRDIIWEHPDEADRIAHFVIDRKQQDVDLILALIESGVPNSLTDGMI